MPYKYAVECVCDKLAATKTYAGKNYDKHLPLEHWRRYGCKVAGNPRTLEFVEAVFIDVAEHGEKYVLSKKYMKKKYAEICLSKEQSDAASEKSSDAASEKQSDAASEKPSDATSEKKCDAVFEK